MQWHDLWNRQHQSFSGKRQETLYYSMLAKDIAALIDDPAAVVLDYGCGKAPFADLVAVQCGKLYLCDERAAIRESLQKRFADNPKIAILAPDELDKTIPPHTLDLLVTASTAQTATLREWSELLIAWKDKLKPGKPLVLACSAPNPSGRGENAAHRLSFAWRGGFLLSTLTNMAHEKVSKSVREANAQPPSQYTESEMVTLLTDAGYKAERLIAPLGPVANRMVFSATVKQQDYL